MACLLVGFVSCVSDSLIECLCVCAFDRSLVRLLVCLCVFGRLTCSCWLALRVLVGGLRVWLASCLFVCSIGCRFGFPVSV